MNSKKVLIKCFDNHLFLRENEIHQAFCEIDKDGNGFITADELKEEMLESVQNQVQNRINQAVYVYCKTRKYPLRRYILGVLTHTTTWDQYWASNKILKRVVIC